MKKQRRCKFCKRPLTENNLTEFCCTSCYQSDIQMNLMMLTEINNHSVSPTSAASSAGGGGVLHRFGGGGYTLKLTVDFTTTQFNFIWKAPSTSTLKFVWGDGTTEEVAGQDDTVITTTSSYSGVGTYNFSISGDVLDLTYIDISSQAFVSGDVSGWSALTSLTYLNCFSTGVTGDVSGWSALTSLTYLRCASTGVTGDVSGWSALTSLTYLNCNSTGVTGDVSGWSALTSLTVLYCASTGVTGDVSGWSALTSLTYLNCFSTGVTFNSTPAWSMSGTIIMYSINNGGATAQMVDNMLASFAATPLTGCTINIAGTNAARTSASDADLAIITNPANSNSLTVNNP